MVRAKFYVMEKKEIVSYVGNQPAFVVELRPVVSGSKENEKFYLLSPGGSFKLETINKEAADHLQVGKEYYIDFTPATAEEKNEK